MLREGFISLLAPQPNIHLVSEAPNGTILLQLVKQYQPHVVITDIRMPELSGIQACKTITENHPNIKVIALSSYDDDIHIIDMLSAGAKGYLLKNTCEEELLTAITVVHNGGTFFSREIEASFCKLLALSRPHDIDTTGKIEFSQREIDVLQLSCKELTNKEIAAILNLSMRTVEAHKDRMLAKVQAKNMVGVIIYAIKHEIINISSAEQNITHN